MSFGNAAERLMQRILAACPNAGFSAPRSPFHREGTPARRHRRVKPKPATIHAAIRKANREARA